jgi:small subunit ribosomal protein S3
VVSSAARRRAEDEGGESAEAAEAPVEAPAELAEGADTVTEAEPLIKEADPELERLLAEEEEIERQTKERHDTPHFRDGQD